MVAAEAGALAGAELGPALADDDHPGLDLLAGEDLHAQHLRLRVADVPRRAESFLVRHYSVSSFSAGFSGLGFAAAFGFGAAFGLASAAGFSATGFSAAAFSALGLAAAFAPPIEVISIWVSFARWPVWRL